ncbi:hypothetical protein EJB05_29597, partial [Eragrostis curvula]
MFDVKISDHGGSLLHACGVPPVNFGSGVVRFYRNRKEIVFKDLKDDTLHEEWESTEEMQLWSMAGARDMGINEKEFAKMLRIKEKVMFPLLQFLEKEMFLKRQNMKKAQVNVDATLATYASHNCQNFEEKKNDTMSMLPGPYCCLDYSQICDVTRYRLYRMKEAVKDKLECGDTLQDNIEDYSAFDAMHLINKGGDTFCCKICNGELVARIDLDGSRKERRKKFEDMAERMHVELSNPFAEEDGAQSSSNFQGSKVLPTWIIRKGMALEKAEKGKQGSNNDETDRQVGVKSKRGDGDYGDDGASIRRRI